MMLYRGLAMWSKFWFSQSQDPNIVCCEVSECGVVETEKHLLFECHRVQPIRNHWLQCFK